MGRLMSTWFVSTQRAHASRLKSFVSHGPAEKVNQEAINFVRWFSGAVEEAYSGCPLRGKLRSQNVEFMKLDDCMSVSRRSDKKLIVRSRDLLINRSANVRATHKQ